MSEETATPTRPSERCVWPGCAWPEDKALHLAVWSQTILLPPRSRALTPSRDCHPWTAQAPEGAGEREGWSGEWCKRCYRRNVIGFEVPDYIWRLVTQSRWNILCPTCFDEEAQKSGVAYTLTNLSPVSWSDVTCAVPSCILPPLHDGAHLGQPDPQYTMIAPITTAGEPSPEPTAEPRGGGPDERVVRMFGHNLRSMRESFGLSMGDLARLLDTTVTAVSALERGIYLSQNDRDMLRRRVAEESMSEDRVKEHLRGSADPRVSTANTEEPKAEAGGEPDPIKALGDLLVGAGAEILFGLEAQGHIPAVERMLAEHASWNDIGEAIGWHGPTVADFYARHYARPELNRLRAENAELRARLDGITLQSFCTKCGWHGEPKPWVRGERPTLGYLCANESCGYAVPEPLRDEIERLKARIAELEGR